MELDALDMDSLNVNQKTQKSTKNVESLQASWDLD